MKQNKHAFNGGIIGPELWSRNDLQRYHSSCKHLDNMVVTAQGGVKRRDPIQLLSKIEIPAEANTVDMFKHYRIIPFVFSASDTFQIILTPTHIRVFKHSIDPIFGGTGTLVKAIPAPYLANIDLSEVNYQQSNDVIYLVHNDLKPKRIERRSDTDWVVVDTVFNGGPYLPLNNNENNIMTFNLPAWNSTTTYYTGDQIIVPNLYKPINGTSNIAYWKSGNGVSYSYKKPNKYYLDVIPMNTDGLAIGDNISITNAGRLTGTWEIQDIISGGVKINTGTFTRWVGNDEDGYHYVWYYTGHFYNNGGGTNTPPPAVSIPNGAAIKYGDGLITTYESITDSNTNHAVTDTARWKLRPTFTDQFTLKSNFNVFKADNVGSTLGIEQSRNTTFQSGSFTAQGNKSGVIPAYGSVTLTTENGIWGGSIQLEESQDNGETWSLLGSINSGSKYNGTITREIERSGSVIRVRMDQWKIVPDHNACKWKLEVSNVGNESTLQVLQYIDETTVKVRPLDYIISSKPTSNWKLGAFSEVNGYPSSICIHEERLFFAGTKAKPSTMYGSKVDDWQDFSSTSYETSPLTFTLASDNVNKIRWMVSKKQLLVGTDTSEWVVSNGDQNKVLSGVNLPSVRKQTDKGSNHLQAMSDNSQVFFIQRDSKQMQSTQFSYEADSYQTKHVSILVPDIAGDNGFVNVSVQRVPSTVMWLTKADGTLVSFTHDEENQVQGFSNHYINAKSATIIGTCVIPDDHSDVVYVLYHHNHVLYYGVMTDKVSLDHSVRFNAKPANVHRLEYSSSPQASNRLLHIKLPKTYKTTHDITRSYKLRGIAWNGGLQYAESFLRDGFKIVPATAGTTFQLVDSGGEDFEWYRLTDLSGNPFVLVPIDTGGDNFEDEDDIGGSSDPNLLPYTASASGDALQIVYNLDNFDISQYLSFQHSTVLGQPFYLGGLTDIYNLTPTSLPEDFEINQQFSFLADMVPMVTKRYQAVPPEEVKYKYGKTLSFNHTGLTFESNRGFNPKVLEVGVPVSYVLNPTVYHADQNSPRTAVIKKLYVYVVKSVGGEVSVDGGKTWHTLKYRGTSDIVNEVKPFTGVLEVLIGSGYREEMEVMVRGTCPHKIHITNMGIEFDVTN